VKTAAAARPNADEPGALVVVEIGGTAVKIGYGVGGAPMEFARTFPTSRIRCATPVLALAALVREAGAEAGLAPAHAVATVPGFIGLDQDQVLNAANIPEINGLALASELRQALGIPVRLERDVVLQLLGEHRAGAVQGENHVLAVYIGTGIGAAYLGEGVIFRGGGWALEIGHMPMHGLGRSLPGLTRDSLETYASGRTLVELAGRHGVAVNHIFSAGRTDPALRAALADILRDQAFAIASAIALLSPRIVLLGGGVVEMIDYPRAELAAIIAEHLPLPSSIRPLDLRWARLGWQAAIWGAIGLARKG